MREASKGAGVKRIVVAFLLGLGLVRGVHGGKRLVTLNTVKTRALAMGGAFVSVKDDLASLNFNPATLSMSSSWEQNQVSVFFNPLGPVLIMENKGACSDLTVPLGWVIRGAGVSVGRVTVGLLLGEESLGDAERLERSDFFDATGYENQRNASFGLCFHLAPRASLGLAGEAFFREEDGQRRLKLGHRYGLYLEPRSNLAVGLCYFDFPNDYGKDRMVLEGLADETLNVGISYSPWEALTLALDIRNVSDEGKGAVREPHVGLEIVPLGDFVLRGGYYRVGDGGEETFSLGIGLFDWNGVLPIRRRFSHPTFGLNVAVLWQRQAGVENRWCFFSCVVRI